MANGSVNLSGRVLDGNGDPKVGLQVDLYTLANYETMMAGGSDTVTATYSGGTDTATGRWNFDSQALTETWVIQVTDGLKKYAIDADNDLQLSELDLVTSLNVNTIYEHTSGSGVTIDGVLIKDGIVTAGGALLPSADDTHDLGSATYAWQDLFLEGDISFTDGGNITFTPSTDDTVVMTASTNGAFSLVTTDTAAAAANIQITADGTVDIDSAGVLTLDSGAAINIEPASGSAILLDGTISIDAGVVTGATSITSTDVTVTNDIAVDGISNLDNTDIDGTLVVDGTNISLDSTTTLNIDNSNTSNGITIGTATSSVPITIGHGTSTVTIGDDLTVTGDLTVSGTTTTVTSTTVAIADSMLLLAKDQGTSADAVDFGFYGKYGVGGTAKYAGIFRDLSATGDPWTFFDGLQAEPGTSVNTAGTGYDLADISAGAITSADGFTGDLTGNVTGNASGSAATLATARAIAVSGDVTGTANFDGSAAISISSTIANDAVTIAKMASLARGKIIVGDSSGNPAALAAGSDTQVLTIDGSGDAVWAAATTGTTSWDAVAAASGGDYTTIQAADDALDATTTGYSLFVNGQQEYAEDVTISTHGVYIFIEGGTTLAGDWTISGNNCHVIVGPGSTIEGAWVLSGTGNTVEFGGGTAWTGNGTLSGVGGTLKIGGNSAQTGINTLSGHKTSILCENGVTSTGLDVSGQSCTFDGGGYQSNINGGTARHAVSVSAGHGFTLKNTGVQTTWRSTNDYDAIYLSGTAVFKIYNIHVHSADRYGIHADSTSATRGYIADSYMDACDQAFVHINQNMVTVDNLMGVTADDGSSAGTGIIIGSYGDNAVVTGCSLGAIRLSNSITIDTNAENCVVIGNRLDGAVSDSSGTSTVGADGTSNDNTAF